MFQSQSSSKGVVAGGTEFPAKATQLSHAAIAAAPIAPLTPVITHQDVAERAHDIYVRNGRREGESQKNWEEAELDLRAHGKMALRGEHRITSMFAPDSVDA